MTLGTSSGFVVSAGCCVLGRLIAPSAEPEPYDISEYPEDGIL